MMDPDSVLSQLLALFAGSLAVVLACKFARMPSILGYALFGALIGPFGIGILSDMERIPQIAEIGMMALLFSIGLKFNLYMFKTLQRHVLLFGGLQFTVCTAIGIWILVSMGIGLHNSLIYASAFSLSSTAVVSKLLLESGEFATNYGTRAISALLLQDMAVVLLLVLIPSLGILGADSSSDRIVFYEIMILLAEVLLLFIVIIIFGPRLMPRWMRFISRWSSSEMFVINLLTIILGFSWVTEHFGFSLALGAFLAGMLLAETPQKYQVEEIIAPFREIFLGFFFIALGTLTDFREILDDIIPVTLSVLAILSVKSIVIYLVSWIESFGDCAHNLRVAIALGGTGEFSFVLLVSSVSYLDPEWFNIFLLSSLVAMAFTPMVWPYLGKVIARFGLATKHNTTSLSEIESRDSGDSEYHMIIFGFGRTGRKIAEMLKRENISYVGIEASADLAGKAVDDREPVYKKTDMADPETVSTVGLRRANVVIITFVEVDEVVDTIRFVRNVNETAQVIAKTAHRDNIKLLKESGANEVIVEAAEGGVLIAALAMNMVGVHPMRIQKHTSETGDATGRLAGKFRRQPFDATDSGRSAPRILMVNIVQGAACIGYSVDSALPREMQVEMVSLRRGDVMIPLDNLPRISANDVLTLLGQADDLFKAEQFLLSGQR